MSHFYNYLKIRLKKNRSINETAGPPTLQLEASITQWAMLPSGPGDSWAEFGSSRERSKQLTRVPAGGAAHQSFTPEFHACGAY